MHDRDGGKFLPLDPDSLPLNGRSSGREQRSVILMDVRPNLIRSRPHRQRTDSMYE